MVDIAPDSNKAQLRDGAVKVIALPRPLDRRGKCSPSPEKE